MLFNSHVFIVLFLPITLIVFFGLARLHLTLAAMIWLAVTSLFFYAYWNVAYLPLLLISILANFFMGSFISRAGDESKKAQLLLVSGILINLGFIGYYKYAGFLAQSINGFLNTDLPVPNIVLPLGISFYTFTQIAYLVDAYRGETKKYGVLEYSLFVSFFPQLIAGPILRHDELIPQFWQKRKFIFSDRNFARGLTLFTLGLSKKMLIADRLSPWVAEVFNHASEVSFLEAWVGALCYTLQLYFDFSGYSDMAIGLGWMFNIELPVNFNSPYKAISISDFWRRWHITLSNFLRDYLYIPLGGNRKGELRRNLNLMITMFLGGLWHGAGWTFVVWGGLHGLYLVIDRQWQRLHIKLPWFLAWFITFFAVVMSWILFRSTSFQDAAFMIEAATGMKGIVLPGKLGSILSWLTPLGVEFKGQEVLSALPYLPGTDATTLGINLGTIIGLLAVAIWCPNTQEIMDKFQPRWWWAVGAGTIICVCLLSLNQVSEFLYFQF